MVGPHQAPAVVRGRLDRPRPWGVLPARRGDVPLRRALLRRQDVPGDPGAVRDRAHPTDPLPDRRALEAVLRLLEPDLGPGRPRSGTDRPLDAVQDRPGALGPVLPVRRRELHLPHVRLRPRTTVGERRRRCPAGAGAPDARAAGHPAGRLHHLDRGPSVRRDLLVHVQGWRPDVYARRHRDPIHRRERAGRGPEPCPGEHGVPRESGVDREPRRLRPWRDPPMGAARHGQDPHGPGRGR